MAGIVTPLFLSLAFLPSWPNPGNTRIIVPSCKFLITTEVGSGVAWTVSKHLG